MGIKSMVRSANNSAHMGAFFYELSLLTIGSILEAISVIVFLVPSQIAPTGVSGVAFILGEFFNTPIGLITLLGNIPIQYLAYRTLGGSRIVVATIYYVVVFSLSIDLLTPIMAGSVSDDLLLNALFGGILGGIGVGLVYRGGGTAGGTATLAKILQSKFGFPLSSAFLYTDGALVFVVGLLFGWEPAMLAIIVIFVGGAASDYILEGPSVIRTIIIVTNNPDAVADVLLDDLERGVTEWKGRGMYTRSERHILFVTVSRAQVNTTRHLVHSVDPNAFIVIAHGQVAYGEGFKAVKSAVTRELTASTS